ncbi:inactive protein RESTRICTED TEV MOVEMENT 1-like [Nicotiana tabacum]|uniref:Inactive protein RESTRICTED TEV MOVEMENT 1-like n=2 Tax=Nicotiana TaxID=4085 RepID=A0A1S3ZH22_TOBAC|nr:PREDICTED: inactive protein RESTRICTED TEV MOVEMENT 1-like [Nicotiana sylvestris]XP_016463616.1 PREDICTED: inactive protein RESTRICTED TEV MOVEMENT 1-like [Nicotiana tabacum]
MDMIKVGPVGGYDIGGTIWDEKGRDQVGGILVSYSKDGVDSLQFLFYENGNLVQSNKHGIHHRENFCAVFFDYPLEFLTSISGSSEKVSQYMSSTILTSIVFGTNKGSYGPFGKFSNDVDNDIDFNFHIGNHRLFGGFHGSQNCHGIESIGVYVKTTTSSMTH